MYQYTLDFSKLLCFVSWIKLPVILVRHITCDMPDMPFLPITNPHRYENCLSEHDITCCIFLMIMQFLSVLT